MPIPVMDSSHFSTSMKTSPDSSAASRETPSTWLEIVQSRVNGLRFGVVQIVIHDGRVTQVESTERVRLPAETSTVSV